MLTLAAVTVAVDVYTAWADISLTTIGAVPISPALPLGLALVAMLGVRRVGLDRINLEAWREFLVIGGAAMGFGIYRFAQHPGGLADSLGLVVGALGEELVYRVAVLMLVGAATARLLGRNWRNSEDWGAVPGLTALFAAGFVFVLLPGHVAQMSDALHALPFACLGVVLGYAVLRTGALLPATVVHALLNLLTIAALRGDVPVGIRRRGRRPRTGLAHVGHHRGRSPARHPAARAVRATAFVDHRLTGQVARRALHALQCEP